jgi:parallel beta-helix repeat protein
MRVLLPLSFFLLPSFGFAQTTWTVDQNGGGNFNAIQPAIDYSGVVNGDTILVMDGTYVENINFQGKEITLRSENGPGAAIIDGNQSGTVVVFENGEGNGAVLDGFTVTNGQSGGGAGIYVRGSSSPTITNNVISNNAAIDDGGGLFCDPSTAPLLTNNTIADNTANNGAGLFLYYSDPTLIGNTITGNVCAISWGSGGGLYCYSSSPVITNSILWGNYAPNGAEGYIYGGSPDINFSNVGGGWPGGTGNINANPRFVAGYYLSQTAAGQSVNSPCVDAGYPAWTPSGTTRTDGVPDSGVPDMGYHDTAAPDTPTLAISNLVAGQTALIEASNAFVGGTVICAYSTRGGGPINTPWGTGLLTPPFTQFSPRTANAAGIASWSVAVPPGASGLDAWLQALDLGSQTLSNGLAVTVQ